MFNKLPKEYYFPKVEGSQFANSILEDQTRPGFVIYKFMGTYWNKIQSFNVLRNFFVNIPLVNKLGYYIDTEESRKVSRANKYLKRQYRRLAKHMNSGNRDKYNQLWWLLATKSEAFIMVVMIKKLKFSIVSFSPEKFLYLKDRIIRIIRKNWTKLNFKRVFLPEYNLDGTIRKYRPLGVPSLEYRVIGGVLEFNLSNWWMRDWSPTQFACRPGYGPIDAWIVILRNIDKWPTIIGYDLAKFFDSIVNYAVLNTLYGELKSIGHGAYRLTASSLSLGLYDSIFRMCHRRPLIDVGDRDKEVLRIEKLIAELNWKKDLKENTLTILSLLRHAAKKMTRDRSVSLIGLPQGFNISPVIACRVLQEQTNLYRRNVVIQYMDDGIKLCRSNNVEREIEELRKSLNTHFTGIDLSGDKTEIIKVGGTWLKPLKFLGCEYDGKTFRAHTRSKGVVEFANANEIEKLIKSIKEKRADLVFKYDRPKLSKAVSRLWNTEFSLGAPTKHDFTEWASKQYVKNEVKLNSIEMRVLQKYASTFQPWIHSTNTMSMIASGFLLMASSKTKSNFVKEAEYFTKLRELALINRLTKEW